MLQLIDIGVNLMHRNYASDREEVIDRAAAVGVSPLIITGTSLAASRNAARYAAQHPGKLYATAGVHPHDAKGCTSSTIEDLRRLAAQKEVVAIGECGLDYDRDFSPRDVQRSVFEAQLELAAQTRMPVFLHERAAFTDFRDLLQKHRANLTGLVVHCFTGTAQELQAYLDLNCHIGITGWICDERRGKPLRDLVKKIPPELLMIETDAPFLTPRDLKDKPFDGRNEPLYLPHILNAVARCMNLDATALGAQTTQNARRFFGLDAEAGV